MKLGWRFMTNPEALWVRILKSKYVKSNLIGNNLMVRLGCSNIWRGLCSVWELVQKGVSWNVGDGHYIRFWKDNWL